MRSAFTTARIRAAESVLMAAQPEGTLMGRAAFALATHAATLLPGVYGSSVALLIGTGNNGGDALYAGAGLARQGVRVRALLLDPHVAHREGLAALLAAGGRIGSAADIGTADLVIDGLLGIGGRPGLKGLAAE